MKPRLGIIDFRPVEYHTLIYQHLVSSGKLNVDVVFLRDGPRQQAADQHFRERSEVDADLLSGYEYRFLSTPCVRQPN